MALVECIDCKQLREIDIRKIVSENKYKKCNCKPKTRETNNPKMKYIQTMLNKKFGSLTVKQIYDGNTAQDIVALCECDCGNKKFETAVANILCGDTRSCGCKIKSNGEIVVGNTLKSLNINYKEQVRFDDLVSPKGRKLVVDFVIYDKNNDVKAFIEYDGPHHYKTMDFSNTVYINESYEEKEERLLENLKYVQVNDAIKNDYASKNGYSMLRIKWHRRISDAEIRDEVAKFIITNKLL